MADENYIIDIILRARDELGPVLAKTAAELEAFQAAMDEGRGRVGAMTNDASRMADTLRNKLNKEIEGVNKAMDAHNRTTETYAQRYDRLGKSIDSSTKSIRDLRQEDEKYSRDLDRLNRDLATASDNVKTNEATLRKLENARKKDITAIGDQRRALESLKSDLYDHQRAYDKLIQAHQRSRTSLEELNRTERQHQAELERTAQAYRRQVDVASRSEQQLQRIRRSGASDQSAGSKRAIADMELEKRKAEELGHKYQQLRHEAERRIGLNVDTKAADAHLDGFMLKKAEAGKDITVNVDMDIGAATAKMAALRAEERKVESGNRGLIASFKELSSHIQNSSNSIASFDNTLRGLAVFLVVALMQQLITVVIALGGELIALASSAIMAGAALGGALTAGVAQAIPAIGLLVGVFQRLQVVMQAVQQTMLVRQQRDAQQQKGDSAAVSSTNSLANAHDGLKSAMQGVVDAQQRLADSQVNLNRTRFEAARQLQDLILQERQAQLTAAGAVLSQEEAQRALTTAIAAGDVAGIASARVSAAQARIGTQQAGVGADRARQDLALQQAGSPLRPDTSVHDAEEQVQQARQALEQAQQGVEQARRGIQSAAASADQAASGFLASGAKMNYMLQQLDNAERGLYRNLLQLRETYLKVFRPITDIIVNSVSHAVDRVDALLHNDQLIASFRTLATSMGQQFNRIIDAFTSPRWVRFFEQMIHEAARNIRPLTSAFLDFADFFRKIAIAAQPVLRFLIRGFADFAQSLKQIPMKDLRDFFEEGLKNLKGWLQLFGAVGRLFAALISSSASTGLRSIKAITAAINELTDWIEKHPRKMAQFWRGVTQVMSALWKVIEALGSELIKSFSPKAVEALGDFLERVLIPALGAAIRLFGKLFIALDDLAKNPFVGTMMQMVAAIVIFKAVTNPLVATLNGFRRTVMAVVDGLKAMTIEVEAVTAEGEIVTGTMSVVEGGFLAVSAAALAIPAAIAAVVAIFIILADKFGVLDDIVRALKQAFTSIVQPIKSAINSLAQELASLFKEIGIGDGSVKGLEEVFKAVFIVFVKNILVPAIHFLGHLLGFFLAQPINMLRAGVQVIHAILSTIKDVFVGLYNFFDDLIHLRIADAFGDLVHIVTSPIRHLIDLAGSLVGDVIDAFSPIGEGILGIFQDLANPLEDAINWIIDNIINRIPGVQVDTIDAGSMPKVTGRGSAHGTAGELKTQRTQHRLQRGGRVGFASGGLAGAHPVSAASIALGHVGDLSGYFDFLPSWMSGLGDWIAGKLKDVIGSVPGRLFGAGKDLIGGAFDAIGSLFAGGGHVFGPSGIDVIPANLTRGEFVVTPHGEGLLEQATGIPGILSWLGRFQRPATGYATGGRVGFADGGPVAAANQPSFGGSSTGKALSQLLQVIGSFGSRTKNNWDDIWDTIQGRTKDGVQFVVQQFSNLTDKIKSSLTQAKNQSQSALQAITGYVHNAMDNSDQAVFKGMGYIQSAVNKGLQAFDSNQKVDFNISAPGHASGGFIGSPGERGGDRVPALLGRGEAVLNWAHQKLVDPAMRAAYGFGLPEMFNRTTAYHGQQAGGGFASGGFTGPGHSGAGFTPVWNLAREKFGMTYFTGFDGHSMMTSSGNVSDHFMHRALDMGNGILTAGEDALNAFFKLKVPEIVKQLIWRDVDQFNGYPIPGHTDHVHLAMLDAYAFDEMRTAKILRAAEKGLNFSQLLVAGADASGAAGFWDDIKTPKAHGPKGGLLSLINAAMTKVTNAANKYGEKIAGTLGMDLMGGSASSLPLPKGAWKRVGATYEGLTGALGGSGQPVGGMSFAELLVAGANAGMYGQDLSATLGYPNQPGLGMPYGSRVIVRKPGTLHPYTMTKNDVGSGQAGNAFYKVDLQDAIADKLSGRTTQDIDVKAMARGGIVDGGFWGKAVPIVAHAGEWVLNAAQQAKAAALAGTDRDSLKANLGFTGGPTSFQGGGEVSSLFSIFTVLKRLIDTLNINNSVRFRGNAGGGFGMDTAQHLFSETTGLLIHGGQQIDPKMKDLSGTIRRFFAALTADGGLLDQLNQSFTDLQTVMATRLAEMVVATRRGGARVTGRALNPDQILGVELDQLHDQLHYLIGEQGVISVALRKARRALEKAREAHDHDAAQEARGAITNLQGRMRDIDSQIAAAQQAVLDKMEEILSARLQDITDDADRTLNAFHPRTGRFGASVRQRVDQAMGFLSRADSLQDEQIDVQRHEAERLRHLLRRARRTGDQALATQIETQLGDLRGSIAEATAQMIQSAQDAIERQAGRREAAIDIQNRIASVQERFGSTIAAEQIRRTALQASGVDIQAQLISFQALLAQARSQGFGAGVTDPLQDKINDLIEQLSENQASLYENTIAIRQAAINQIQERQGFLGGVTGGLSDIITKVGQITGIVDTQKLVELMTSALNQLQNTGQDLRNQMTRFVQSNSGGLPQAAIDALSTLQGLHGGDFVSALQGLDLNNIIDTLGGPDSPLAQQFESLIQAIIDNENAVQDNTDQLQQLNGQSQIQSFSSTAWQWFRKAIFTGMGGLLPQYAAGEPFSQAANSLASSASFMASGGIDPAFASIAPNGAATMTTGMSQIQPTGSSLSLEDVNALVGAAGDINLTVNEAEPGTDPTYLANRIAFARKTPTS